MPVRAVFLDVGETLVDETRNWEAWADHLGVPRFTLLGVLGGIAARGDHHTEVFTRLAPGLDIAAADRERRARGLFDGYGPQDLYPDALPCLRALKAAGFRVGVAGNQPTEVEAFLHELDASVDVVASSASWGVAKPSPEFFLRVAMAARVTPAEIAYVGDRVDNDVMPAVRAGMIAVHLRRGPWGHLQADWPQASLAAVQIRTLADLSPALLARSSGDASRAHRGQTTAMVATSLTVTPPPFADDLRRVVRHAGIAAASGALVGLVVGGILGRIAMLVLRVTTGDSITGVTSDDGFEIGRVTLAGTLNLMLAYSLAGTALGLIYAVARRFLPQRGRVAAWTALCAAVGGSIFVHADGVDYLLLDPLWLAVAFFVALPGLAGLGVALVVERLERTGELARWQMVAAGVGTVALFAIPAAVAAALLALGRVPVLRRLADSRFVRALAIVVVLGAVVATGADLVSEARVILSR